MKTFLRSPNNISFIPPSGINSQTQSSSNIFIGFHKKSQLNLQIFARRLDGVFLKIYLLRSDFFTLVFHTFRQLIFLSRVFHRLTRNYRNVECSQCIYCVWFARFIKNVFWSHYILKVLHLILLKRFQLKLQKHSV